LSERRIALVIGNSHYKSALVPALVNPKNDATDVANELKGLGFQVILVTDSDKRGMEMALQKFARESINADSALFFYAGHALQFQGQNYLMPVDAELEDEVSLPYQTVPISEVRTALDRANGVKIMILDACRNNPLAKRLQMASGRTRSVGSTRGLARIDKTQGMVIAYATAADDVAMDGKGRNSPFTTALLKRMAEPGLEIEMMFRRIAADVNSSTDGRQRPETYISLLSEYYLNQTDRAAWDKIKDDLTVDKLRDFIRLYPASTLYPRAQQLLTNLESAAREREADRLRQAAAELERQRKAFEAARVHEKDLEVQARTQATLEAKRAEEAKQAAADETRKQAEAAEQARRQQEAAAREQKRLDEQARLAQAERQKQIDLRKQAEAAELARRQAETAEQARRQAQAEQLRLQQEAAAREQARRAQEARMAEEKRKALEARQKADEQRKAQAVAALAPPQAASNADIDQVCRREDEHIALLQAAGTPAAMQELGRFTQSMQCERLRPVAMGILNQGKPTVVATAAPVAPVPPAHPAPVAAPDSASALQSTVSDADVPAPPERPQVRVQQQASLTPPAAPAQEEPQKPLTNTPELVKQAQALLRETGCYNSVVDGDLGPHTRHAVRD
jgi:uncharacterized caspase-like protein